MCDVWVENVTQIFLTQGFLMNLLSIIFSEKIFILVKLVCLYGILCWHLCRKTCSFHNSVVDIGRVLSSVDFEQSYSGFFHILYTVCVIENYFSKC